MLELTALEQGAMIQNLGLTAEALGIGGFAHFAVHPHARFEALGFRMDAMHLSRIVAAGPLLKLVLRLLRKDTAFPVPVGLERGRGGEVLIKPFCPPYYRDMEEAVRAFVDFKFAAGTGTHRDGGHATAWREPREVQAGIPCYSEEAVAATIAYCDYVYRRYGRFPAKSGPLRTILAYQAHRLDWSFYDRFYRPGTYRHSPTVRPDPTG